MSVALRCSGPACRPHPASLPVCVPPVEGLPSASFGFASQLRLIRLRLPSSAPIGSFHPIRSCPCWAMLGNAGQCWAMLGTPCAGSPDPLPSNFLKRRKPDVDVRRSSKRHWVGSPPACLPLFDRGRRNRDPAAHVSKRQTAGKGESPPGSSCYTRRSEF